MHHHLTSACDTQPAALRQWLVALQVSADQLPGYTIVLSINTPKF